MLSAILIGVLAISLLVIWVLIMELKFAKRLHKKAIRDLDHSEEELRDQRLYLANYLYLQKHTGDTWRKDNQSLEFYCIPNEVILTKVMTNTERDKIIVVYRGKDSEYENCSDYKEFLNTFRCL